MLHTAVQEFLVKNMKHEIVHICIQNTAFIFGGKKSREIKQDNMTVPARVGNGRFYWFHFQYHLSILLSIYKL